jgi:hypothetical protein
VSNLKERVERSLSNSISGSLSRLINLKPIGKNVKPLEQKKEIKKEPAK